MGAIVVIGGLFGGVVPVHGGCWTTKAFAGPNNESLFVSQMRSAGRWDGPPDKCMR
jgi:hypothetical protein